MHALEPDRPTAPAPDPTVLEELVAELEPIATRAKPEEFPMVAGEIARPASVAPKG
ncbi:MAG: hypothetical protein VYE22_10045 [Myxococcota bacterium]|nr:hypothetical protein [Myxococcota bacterium]